MITIQEIETALKNAGWKKVEIEIEGKWQETGDWYHIVWRFMFDFGGCINGLLDGCYETGIHFKKDNIGVYDYDAYNNTDELIEDLRSWL